MAISLQNLDDFILATQDLLEKGKVQDISLPLTRYTGYKELCVNRKVRKGGGSGITLRLNTTSGTSAQHVGLYHKDTSAPTDGLVEGTVPWRISQAAATFDVMEQDMNSNSATQILDVIEMRLQREKNGLVELVEETLWTKPASDADNTTPYGIPMWIVDGTTTGHTGLNPAGFTSGVGGISSTTYPKWANYYAQYTNITRADFLDKLDDAVYETGFEAPIETMKNMESGGNGWGFFTTRDVQKALSDMARAQNDNLGKDVMAMKQDAIILNTVVKPVPYLDANESGNPFYGIYWPTFEVFTDGTWEKMSKPMPAADQHNVRVVFIESRWNTRCVDRRRNFKLKQ